MGWEDDLDIARRVLRAHMPDFDFSNFNSLIENYGHETALCIAYKIADTGYRIRDEEVTQSLIDLVGGNEPETAERIVGRISHVAWRIRDKEIVETCIDLYSLLDCFDDLCEFGKYLLANRARAKDVERTVEKNWEFLGKQPSETAVPLLAIMTILGEEYYPNVRESDGNCKLHLARAYAIAAKNINEETGKNYLSHFYDGLRQCLDERPDDLGRWAASITSDFSKQGEKGLLRGVVG